MSDKTNRYRWLPWAVAFVSMIAIGMGAGIYFNWYLDPWDPADNLVTKIAVNEFGRGTQDLAPYWNLRLGALAAVLLLFVIGPSLWVYAEIRNQSKETGDVLKKGFAWYIGVIVVLTGLLAVPATVVKGIIFQNTWERAAQSKNKDKLRSGLTTLAYDAYEQYYLPPDLEGGLGSFRAIPAKNGEARTITLADLESYNSNSQNSYLLAPVESDSTITIYGIGHKQGPDPDFENADGQRGRIQIAVKVAPPGNFEFTESNTN